MSREQTAQLFASRATEGSELDSLVRHVSPLFDDSPTKKTVCLPLRELILQLRQLRVAEHCNVEFERARALTDVAICSDPTSEASDTIRCRVRRKLND
jgi:hypothetical protein